MIAEEVDARLSSFWSEYCCPSRGRVAESDSPSGRLFGSINAKDEAAFSNDKGAPASARCKCLDRHDEELLLLWHIRFPF